MWLINVNSRQLEEFIGDAQSFPPYAILSHTWEPGQEVSFQEMRQSSHGDKRGYAKINLTCQQAVRDGLGYAWVDTCCIDKSSSAELSEAINSMFNWYKWSAACYAYLHELTTIPDHGLLAESIAHCAWFTRGWTLQELIAPVQVHFFNGSWDFCFSKSNASHQLAKVTGIDAAVLEHTELLSTISVARKMSWAAARRTTRTEDMAYCLLGVFDINMPLLYGEGQKAFQRLQVEIINSVPDPSIFAWTLPSAKMGEKFPSESFSGVLARSPDMFSGCGGMTKLTGRLIPDFSMSNRGIKLRARFALYDCDDASGTATNSISILPVCDLDGKILCICTRNIGEGSYVRQDASGFAHLEESTYFHRLLLEPSLLARLPGPNGLQSREALLSSRSRCLKVDLPPGMRIYRRWPWQQWDEVDRVFFQADSAQSEWASLKIVAQPPHGGQSVDFLFHAFSWASSTSAPPRCSVYRVFGQLPDRYLEDMHDRAVAESWDAYWIQNRLSVAHADSGVAVVGNASRNCYTPVILFELKRVSDPKICQNPFWKVDFSW
jgi:hypothetical protein